MIADADGSNPRKLVPGSEIDYNAPGGDFRPSWSPDGQTIAFSSDRDTGFPHQDYPGPAGKWEHVQAAGVYVICSRNSPAWLNFRACESSPPLPPIQTLSMGSTKMPWFDSGQS